jgi:hypothetical protein
LEGAHPLFSLATHGLPCLAAATIARFFEMGASFQISQDSVLQDQPLEKSDRPFDPAIPHGHLERTVPRRIPAVEARPALARPTSEGHPYLLGDTPPVGWAAPPETIIAARLGSSRRTSEDETV